MALGTIAAMGASLVGGFAQASAAKKAASAQQQAADKDLALRTRMYDETVARSEPFYQSGVGANNALNYELGLGDKPEGYGGFQASEGYKFALDQGTGAIDRGAAARGGVFSGNTLKAQTGYATGLAQQDYGNFYNRLAGQANAGQNAAALQANAGQNYAQGASNALSGAANAQAAGAIGVGNAINSTIGNGIGLWQYQNSLNKPQGQGGESWWGGMY